ncbi:hypothetical protein HAX54_025076 [Datura stramonium]|uniref:Uncharacterized protein n=1 Tax=Datura stramonium TaxID=4076 RepID=A0ABS8V128_DATST|nr:hypothetical protein [Datura stramonium]
MKISKCHCQEGVSRLHKTSPTPFVSSQGQVCKNKALISMEAEEAFPEVLEEELAQEIPDEVEEEQGEVSLSEVLGLEQAIMILIDSGSTHIFVDPQVVK